MNQTKRDTLGAQNPLLMKTLSLEEAEKVLGGLCRNDTLKE